MNEMRSEGQVQFNEGVANPDDILLQLWLVLVTRAPPPPKKKKKNVPLL